MLHMSTTIHIQHYRQKHPHLVPKYSFILPTPSAIHKFSTPSLLGPLFDFPTPPRACSWLISKEPLPAVFGPPRAAFLHLLPFPSVLLVMRTCWGVFPLVLVVILLVMDVGCVFSAFSRCLLSCIIFFFFFVLQYVFRVNPLLLMRSTVIREVKASGTVC